MNTLKKVVRGITNRKIRFGYLSKMGFFNHVSDEMYLKWKFRVMMGRKLDLENPQTFNEKLQWLKIHDRNPQYTTLVDKYAVKRYVAEVIGAQYVIPTLGVWNHFDEIDFDALPEQFVLKCTHDSGGLAICKNKGEMDKAAAKKKLEKSLKRNYYLSGREWPYKDVPPRIIAEKYMSDGIHEDLKDYKFYCFDGKMKFMMINSDRNSEKPTKADYFDRNFQWLDFSWGYTHAAIRPDKPPRFEEMIEIAEKLSEGIPHVRVDLYECNGQIYFGELTFFDGSGFDRIDPVEWDYRIGTMLQLPALK